MKPNSLRRKSSQSNIILTKLLPHMDKFILGFREWELLKYLIVFIEVSLFYFPFSSIFIYKIGLPPMWLLLSQWTLFSVLFLPIANGLSLDVTISHSFQYKSLLMSLSATSVLFSNPSSVMSPSILILRTSHATDPFKLWCSRAYITLSLISQHDFWGPFPGMLLS